MSFTGTLHPYQEPAVELVTEEMKTLVAFEMGLGKTPLTIAAIEQLAEEEQVDAGLIVALSSLKYQWQKAIAKFTCTTCLAKLEEGEDGHQHTPSATSIVIDGTPAERQRQYAVAAEGNHRYVIINYEQVVNDWPQVKKLPRDFVIADECFVAGTLVDTPLGRVPIETIRPGDVVLNATGVAPVLRVIQKEASVLIRVVLEDGREVVTTPTHKFFTPEGWLTASMLEHGTLIVHRDEALRLVREADADVEDVPLDGVSSDADRALLREVLLREVADAAARGQGGSVHTGAVSEAVGAGQRVAGSSRSRGAGGARTAGPCGLDPCVCGEAEGHLEGEREHLPRPAGQWHRADDARGHAPRGVAERVGVEPRGVAGEEEAGLPDQLQSGSCASRGEAGSRGRWAVSHAPLPAGAGRQEDRDAGVSRVDRVEVLEPGDPGWATYGGGAGTAPVFDLEIEQHPSYSVEGLLVHNCTMVKSFKSQRSRRMKRLQAPYMIGLTGTPMENGKLEEVFSIMQFLDENVLGRFDIFDRTFIIRNNFGGVQRYRNVPLFRETMKRSWIVKTQDDPDVAPYMPKVTSKNHFPVLDASSAKLYRSIANDLIVDLGDALSKGMSGFDLYAHYTGGGSDAVDALRGQIMAKMTALQMLCDHPHLLVHSAQLYAKSLQSGKVGGSEYAYNLQQSGALDVVAKIKAPPKMAMAVELLERILEREGNKAVLFSHDVPTLALLKAALPAGIAVTYDGTMSAKEKEANKNRFQIDPKVRVLLSSDAGGFGVDLPQGNHLCVEATTPVLTADLRWAYAGDLRPGDGILGCEEESRGGRGNSRRWQLGTVTNNHVEERDCVRVELSNGDTLVVTPEHPLLVRSKGSRWIAASDLWVGAKVPRYLDTWGSASSFDAGWLSGMFDGEGCVVRSGNGGLHLSIAQNPGPVLDRVTGLLAAYGFRFSLSQGTGSALHVHIRGGKAESMRALGVLRPVRLLNNWQKMVEQHLIQAIETPSVVSITDAGRQLVSVLETSTRTFNAAGYMQHNCNYDMPWSNGALKQRNSRIIRASSKFDRIFLHNLLVKGSIDEWMYTKVGGKIAASEAFVLGKGLDSKGGLDMTTDGLMQYLLKESP